MQRQKFYVGKSHYAVFNMNIDCGVVSATQNRYASTIYLYSSVEILFFFPSSFSGVVIHSFANEHCLIAHTFFRFMTIRK